MADPEDNATDSVGASSAGVEFSHPMTVTVDHPFELEIDNIPRPTVDVTLTLVDAAGTAWTATDSYTVTDDTLLLGRSRSSGAGHTDVVPALLQQATPSEDQTRYSPPRGTGEEVTIRSTPTTQNSDLRALLGRSATIQSANARSTVMRSSGRCTTRLARAGHRRSWHCTDLVAGLPMRPQDCLRHTGS